MIRREAIKAMLAALAAPFVPAILEQGLEWQALTVPPEDLRFIETRKFSVELIARCYRLPPRLLVAQPPPATG